jgi:hypothetical protein
MPAFIKGYKAGVYDRSVVLKVVVKDVLHTFLTSMPIVSIREALNELVYEKIEAAIRRCCLGDDVEVGLGDSSIYGVIEDVNGIWVKLRAKVGGDDFEYLIPVFSIRYVRRLMPASRGNRQ